MARIHLFHWHETEATERITALNAMGHAVSWTLLHTAATLRELGRHPPSLVLIDLGRLPSHGRDVARSLAATRSTRSIPIVFVGGGPEKVAHTRELFPEAGYVDWGSVGEVVEQVAGVGERKAS